MRLRLLIITSAVAAVLCALVIVAWVRSASHPDEFAVSYYRRFFVLSVDGRIGLGVAQLWTYDGADALTIANRPTRHREPPMVRTRYPDRLDSRHRFTFLLVSNRVPGEFGIVRPGVNSLSGSHFENESASVIYFPHWAAVLVLASLSLLPVPAIRARRRRLAWLRAGRCGNCGYDLRATPGRCPECGVVKA